MDIYRTVPLFHVVFPDFSNDTPGRVQANINPHMINPDLDVAVSYVDDADPSQGLSIQVGEQAPVVVSSGGFCVNPFTGAVLVFPNVDAVGAANSPTFMSVGPATLYSDRH